MNHYLRKNTIIFLIGVAILTVALIFGGFMSSPAIAGTDKPSKTPKPPDPYPDSKSGVVAQSNPAYPGPTTTAQPTPTPTPVPIPNNPSETLECYAGNWTAGGPITYYINPLAENGYTSWGMRACIYESHAPNVCYYQDMRVYSFTPPGFAFVTQFPAWFIAQGEFWNLDTNNSYCTSYSYFYGDKTYLMENRTSGLHVYKIFLPIASK